MTDDGGTEVDADVIHDFDSIGMLYCVLCCYTMQVKRSWIVCSSACTMHVLHNKMVFFYIELSIFGTWWPQTTGLLIDLHQTSSLNVISLYFA